MAYKPYNMKGHTLPGINQKSSPAKHTAEPHISHSALTDPDNIAKIKGSIARGARNIKGWSKKGHKSGDTKGAIKKEQRGVDSLKRSLANIQEKTSPTKWVQAVAALAPVVMDMMKKKKEDSPTKDRQSRLEKKQKRHKEKYIEEGAKRGDVNVSKYMKHKRKYKKTSKKLGHGGEYTGGRSSVYIKERPPQKP